MRILKKSAVEQERRMAAQKNPHAMHNRNVYKHVDNVDKYVKY
jgi:hypothetical protein